MHEDEPVNEVVQLVPMPIKEAKLMNQVDVDYLIVRIAHFNDIDSCKQSCVRETAVDHCEVYLEA